MTLYLVSTPIGNLEDITLRAIRTLKEVNGVIAEDSRHTQKLLHHYEIKTPVSFRFHEPLEKKQLPKIIAALQEGKNLALVTDAGAPGISDPGFRLVREAVAEGIEVVPIPGPCAAICALQASGLPTDHFLFVGFLPEKEGKRLKYLETFKNISATLIIYLSPWKALKNVEEILKVLGDRSVSMGREMTKLHEEFWRGNLSGLLERLQSKPPKGEIALIVQGNASPSPLVGEGRGEGL